MKTTAPFILSILLFLTQLSQAQTCLPIPMDPTSMWRIDYNYFEPEPWTFNGWEFRAFVAGDSVVNGQTYTLLKRSGIYTFQHSPVYTTTTFENSFYGLIRMEDSKLYVNYDGFEFFLFDYNAQAGDSLYSEYYGHGFMNPLIIQSVDTIQIDGVNHRRYWLPVTSELDARFFIEGIGHEYGLLEPIHTFEDYAALYCYAENGNSIYIQDTLLCDFTIGIQDITPVKFEVSVYPNPACEQFTISLQNHTTGVVVLNDLSGRQVLEQQLTNKTTTLDVNGTKPGLYIYTIVCGNAEYMGKLIIY